MTEELVVTVRIRRYVGMPLLYLGYLMRWWPWASERIGAAALEVK